MGNRPMVEETSPMLGGNRDRGASLAEYALLIVLVAIVAMPAIGVAGSNTEKAFGNVAGSLDEVAAPAPGGETTNPGGGGTGTTNPGGDDEEDPGGGGSGPVTPIGGGEPNPEPGPTDPVDHVTLGNPAVSQKGNKWIATVPVTNSGSEPITIEVTIVDSSGKTTTVEHTIQPGQTIDLSSGELQRTPPQSAVNSVTFQVTVLDAQGNPVGSLGPVTAHKP
jgi:Flp pilus assembly pilin Flp